MTHDPLPTSAALSCLATYHGLRCVKALYVDRHGNRWDIYAVPSSNAASTLAPQQSRSLGAVDG